MQVLYEGTATIDADPFSIPNASETLDPITADIDGAELWLDTNAVTLADEFQVSQHEMVQAAGTQRLVHRWPIMGPQPDPIVKFKLGDMGHGWDVRLQLMNSGSGGTARALPWSIRAPSAAGGGGGAVLPAELDSLLRVEAGDIGRSIKFQVLDATTKEPVTGLVSGDFTVRRQRGSNAAAAMTTPTIAEDDATAADGYYRLLMDEDMVLTDGALEELITFRPASAGCVIEPVAALITRPHGAIGRWTADGGSASTIQAPSGVTLRRGDVVQAIAGAGVGQARTIIAVDGQEGSFADDLEGDPFAAGTVVRHFVGEPPYDIVADLEDAQVSVSVASVTPSGATDLSSAIWGGAAGLAVIAALTAIDDFLDTEIAAIKAKTDNLPSDPADESSIQSTLGVIAAYLDTEIAAIKTKTDQLAFTAGKVDAQLRGADGDTITASALATDAVQEIRDAILNLSLGATYSNLTVLESLKASVSHATGAIAGLVNGSGAGTLTRPDGSTAFAVANKTSDGNRGTATITP